MEVAILGTLITPCYYILHRMFAHKFEERDVITRDQLNTGDLILFCHNDSRLSHNLANIEYSHIGMVWRWPENNRLYIMELTTEGDNHYSKNKPGIYDMEERLRRYNGYISIRSVKPEYRHLFNVVDMLSVFKELEDLDFDYSFVAHFLKKNVLGLNRELNNEYCCSEFIYLFLSKLRAIEYCPSDLQDSFRLLSTEYRDIWTDQFDLES